MFRLTWRHLSRCDRAAAILFATLLVKPSSSDSTSLGLDGDVDLASFLTHGFLVIRGFAGQEEVSQIRAAISTMVDAWEPPSEQQANASLSIRTASSKAVGEHVDHSFLLDSAAQASFFLERKWRDLVSLEGAQKRSALRKVGHGIHWAPEAESIRRFVRSPRLARLVSGLGWRRPVVAQTLYRFAHAFADGIERHRDSNTLYTDPPTCLGIWLALEDAGTRNGCLRVRPGSHLEPLRERFVRRRRPDGSFDLVFERVSTETDSVSPESAFTALEVASGDMVVIHGSLEHFSLPGIEPNRTRESLQIHVVEADARWSEDNWLQYSDDKQFMDLGSPWPERHEL
eukprot:TRINITY_DN16723_c0_g2_i1.p1 TRINITY_DN16723_c0_g2~~TRINITY_DN16723_c0_g2_i1.p1  ORF type:complete len:343 (+),score=45.27 TRINITY_DN16723_c0_g2_i1:99-1127(+)